MKKLFIIALSALALTACQKSIEERAQQEASEYTRKYCPTPVYNFTRTDSLTFDPTTRTFSYHCSLTDRMDDSTIIAENAQSLREALVKEVKGSTTLKLYKDAGMSFQYIIRSEKNPAQVLLQTTIEPKDYQ